MLYQLELIWNREFHFVRHGKPTTNLDRCIASARQMEELGDGASVKETRIVNDDGEIVWQYGQKVNSPNEPQTSPV